MELKIKNETLNPKLQARIDTAFSTLPRMTVRQEPFRHSLNYKDDKQLWTMDNEGIHGAFFDVNGYVISNGDFSWFQPAIAAKGEMVDGVCLIGIVIRLMHEDSNWMSVGNEPFKVGHRAIKPGLQTSWTKLQQVRAGDIEKDAGLARILPFIGGAEKLDKFEWKLADCAHDGNRQGGGYVAYADLELSYNQFVELSFPFQLGLHNDEIEEIKEKQRTLFNPHALATI